MNRHFSVLERKTIKMADETKVGAETEDQKAPWVNKVKLTTEELIKKKFEDSGIVPGFLSESPPNTILIIYQSGNRFAEWAQCFRLSLMAVSLLNLFRCQDQLGQHPHHLPISADRSVLLASRIQQALHDHHARYWLAHVLESGGSLVFDLFGLQYPCKRH